MSLAVAAIGKGLPTSDNVATCVGNVNECIFEVWRGHVGIFADPPPVEQVVWKDGQWTAEELMKVLPETLTRGKSRDRLPHTMPFFMTEIEE